jgi:hypothetical protein
MDSSMEPETSEDTREDRLRETPSPLINCCDSNELNEFIKEMEQGETLLDLRTSQDLAALINKLDRESEDLSLSSDQTIKSTDRTDDDDGIGSNGMEV